MAILLTNGCSFTYGDELRGSRSGFFPDGTMVPPSHHRLTFTHHLAQKLAPSEGYVNLAANGSSNQKIFRRTTTFLQQTSREVSHIVIIWSSWGRMELVSPHDPRTDKIIHIQKENGFNQIIPDHHSGKLAYQLRHWGDGKETTELQFGSALKDFYEHCYSFPTPIVHHLNYMCIMQDLCDAKGIPLVMGVIHPGMWDNIKSVLTSKRTKDEKELRSTIRFYLGYLRDECKLGLGNKLDMTSVALNTEGCDLLPFHHPCARTQEVFADILYDRFVEIEKRNGNE